MPRTPPVAETRWRRRLLSGGILAPLLYIAMTLSVGLLWDGYSASDQTVSELSAIGAPTRALWLGLGGVYAVLMLVFGWTLWTSAPADRSLRVVGALLMIHSVTGSYWPPMHQRAVLAAGGGTLTDTLHLAWAMVTSICFLAAIGVGSRAFGMRFRIYSLATMIVSLASGAIGATFATQIQANLPTPGAGTWERINIAAVMLWIAMLAVLRMRARDGSA